MGEALKSNVPTTPDDPKELIKFVENLKRQWMSTIDALVDPIMIVTKDYQITKANRAMASHANEDVREIIGRKCFQVFAGRESPCLGCSMPKSAESVTAMTYELTKAEGTVFEVTSQPLIDGSGNLDGVVQVYRDRTQAKLMQEKLSQQEKLASIGLLAGGVAHEINNPLGGILIFSQMVLKEMDKASPHYQDIIEIEAATQRCKAIVESLLDFARQNPGKTKKLEEFEIHEAIKTAIRFGKVGAKANSQIEIIDELDKNLHFVTGNRNKIVQLFLNLIQNGIQAMPDGGTVSVVSGVTKKADKTIGVYHVRDEGVGIPKEHLKKIFDPFFTTKDPGEGTGLGLALCYGIAQDLGGQLSVESKINQGTTFTVEIPLTKTEGAA
jgi:two-component system, NtrC family, sensor kinase